MHRDCRGDEAGQDAVCPAPLTHQQATPSSQCPRPTAWHRRLDGYVPRKAKSLPTESLRGKALAHGAAKRSQDRLSKPSAGTGVAFSDRGRELRSVPACQKHPMLGCAQTHHSRSRQASDNPQTKALRHAAQVQMPPPIPWPLPSRHPARACCESASKRSLGGASLPSSLKMGMFRTSTFNWHLTFRLRRR